MAGGTRAAKQRAPSPDTAPQHWSVAPGTLLAAPPPWISERSPIPVPAGDEPIVPHSGRQAQAGTVFRPHVAGFICNKVTSQCTWEEAAEVREFLDLMGARSALLVTSAYHTRRALSIFRRVPP